MSDASRSFRVKIVTYRIRVSRGLSFGVSLIPMRQICCSSCEGVDALRRKTILGGDTVIVAGEEDDAIDASIHC